MTQQPTPVALPQPQASAVEPSPELVQVIAARVYALWRRELTLMAERTGHAGAGDATREIR